MPKSNLGQEASAVSSSSVALNNPADFTAVATMDSGLQVPVYLLRRDAERKQVEVDTNSEAPPRFYKIAAYSVKFPARTAIIALSLGMLLGKFWVKV